MKVSELSLRDTCFFAQCEHIIKRQASLLQVRSHCLLSYEELVGIGYQKLAVYFPLFQLRYPDRDVTSFYKGFKATVRNEMLNERTKYLRCAKRGFNEVDLSIEVERVQATALPLADYIERDAAQELWLRLSPPAQLVLEQMLNPNAVVVALAATDALRCEHVRGSSRLVVRYHHIARYFGVGATTIQKYISEIRQKSLLLFPEYAHSYKTNF